LTSAIIEVFTALPVAARRRTAASRDPAASVLRKYDGSREMIHGYAHTSYRRYRPAAGDFYTNRFKSVSSNLPGRVLRCNAIAHCIGLRDGGPRPAIADTR